MRPSLLQTKEEQRIYCIYAKVLIARLILFVLMLFPIYWRSEGVLGEDQYYFLLAIGNGLMCTSAVYMLIISVATGVSVFVYSFIKTERFETMPVFYIINMLFGIGFTAITGILTYACLVSLFR